MTILLAAGGGLIGPAFYSQLIAFAVVTWVIWKFGVPFFRKKIDERTRSVGDEFDRLAAEEREALRQIEEIRGRLATLDQETRRRLDEATKEGELARARAQEEARAQAAAEIEKARRTIQIERDKAVLELRSEAVRLTLEETERRLDVTVNEGVHGRMVERYLGTFEKAARP